MAAALEYVSPGNWESVQQNFDTISSNLRPALPQARVFHNANQPILGGTFTILAFNSVRYNNGAMYDAAVSNTRLTAKITGLYSIGASLEWFGNVTGDRFVILLVNGATSICRANQRALAGAGNNAEQSLSTEYHLSAGEFVQVMVIQDSGGVLNVLAAPNYSPEFWMHRIGGFTNEGVAA
jgi:hypothetical protein